MFDREKNYKNVSVNVQGYEKYCTITIATTILLISCWHYFVIVTLNAYIENKLFNAYMKANISIVF